MAYAIVTPSFAGDFERCRLLAESIERFVEGEHYVLVDDIDIPQFRELERFGTRIVDSRDLISSNYKRLPFSRVWMSKRGRPVRGWMTQQLRKMAFAAQAPTEHFLFVDSDIVFVRSFAPNEFHRNGRSPLFMTEWFNKESLGWANQSRRLLQLPGKDSSHGYVHPTFWTREVTRKMLEALETRGPWQDVISSQSSFSEYTLYGIFAEEKVGLDELGLYPFNEPLMHLSWAYDTSNPVERDRFIRDLPETSYAMMFHSKHRTPVTAYEQQVRAIWPS